MPPSEHPNKATEGILHPTTDSLEESRDVGHLDRVRQRRGSDRPSTSPLQHPVRNVVEEVGRKAGKAVESLPVGGFRHRRSRPLARRRKNKYECANNPPRMAVILTLVTGSGLSDIVGRDAALD